MRKAILLSILCIAAAPGVAPEPAGDRATALFTSRALWQAAVGEDVTTIDFRTWDDGTLITSPAADVHFNSLVLQGVEFVNVRSYWNTAIYVFPNRPLRVNLPPGTREFGADLVRFFPNDVGHTITLSTGEVFHVNPVTAPWTMDFFGFVSDEPVAWVEFQHAPEYLKLDNFSFRSDPVLSAADLIRRAREDVSSLAAADVATPGNQTALTNFLTQALVALEVGDVSETVSKVTTAIWRVDGCAAAGVADGNGGGRDWVVSCPAQLRIQPLLVRALELLGSV